MKAKVNISPIQGEIIYTLINDLFNGNSINTYPNSLSTIIYGHYSYSSVITRAINSLIERTGDELVSNSRESLFLNLKSIKKLGIDTDNKDDFWEQLVNHPKFSFKMNDYVILLEKSKIYGEFVSSPSYYRKELGNGRSCFSNLDVACRFSFRQDASKMAISLRKNFNSLGCVDLSKGKSGEHSLIKVKDSSLEMKTIPRMKARLNNPHILIL